MTGSLLAVRADNQAGIWMRSYCVRNPADRGWREARQAGSRPPSSASGQHKPDDLAGVGMITPGPRISDDHPG